MPAVSVLQLAAETLASGTRNVPVCDGSVILHSAFPRWFETLLDRVIRYSTKTSPIYQAIFKLEVFLGARALVAKTGCIALRMLPSMTRKYCLMMDNPLALKAGYG
jgi:hypothetical protein